RQDALLHLPRPRRPGRRLQLPGPGACRDRTAGRGFPGVPARAGKRHARLLDRPPLRQGSRRHVDLAALAAGTQAGEGLPAAQSVGLAVRIGDDARKCVVFFSVPSPRASVDYGGTGFLAAFDGEQELPFPFLYLITARHVATTLQQYNDTG